MGVWQGPPKVEGLPKPASSTSTRSTLGAPAAARAGFGKSGLEPSSVRFETPLKAGSGRGMSDVPEDDACSDGPVAALATLPKKSPQHGERKTARAVAAMPCSLRRLKIIRVSHWP